MKNAQDKLQAITNTLHEKYPGSKVVYKSVDIQSYEAVERAVNASVEQLGHIDILVNNVSPHPCSY